jgi:signal peptidase II
VRRIYRLALITLILVSCVGCDQVTKSIAKASLASSAPISLLNDSIRVEYTENPGGLLSLGASLPSEIRFLFFVIFVSATLILTLALAVNMRSFNLMQLIGMCLVAAGGVGNFLDRLFNNGAAIDFLRLGIGPLQTAIFNLADVAIMAGALVFLLASAKTKSRTTAS